jgi:hypothetical protein
MSGKLLDRFRQKGPSRPRSKAETEKRRRVLIVLLIVLAVVSSVSVVGYGYYDTSIRPWHQRIVKVNGTVIEMREFVKTLRAYLAMDAMYGGTTSPSAQLAEGVAESIIEESELMRQGLESQIGDDAIEARYEEWLKGLVSDNATDEELEQIRKSASEYFHQWGLSERDYRELWIEPQLVREEFQKQIGDARYPATDNFEHAQVQALLVTGSDNATQLRARWEAGEAFDALTSDNSVSSYQRDFAADNTTIEWVAKGIKSTAFDDYTFSENTTLGVISQPMPDTDNPDNYWLTKKVADTAWTPLSETDRSTLISKAFTKWLEDAKNPENNDIVYYLSKKGGQAKLAWALDHVAVSKS